MSSVSYGDAGGVTKQFGEWSQLRDSMYAGFALPTSESRQQKREQLVQELLAQMASGSPGGGRPAAGTSSSCGEDQQTQWDPAASRTRASFSAESWLKLRGTGSQQAPGPSSPQWGAAPSAQFSNLLHQQTGRQYEPAFFAQGRSPPFMSREAYNSSLIQSLLSSQVGWPPRPNTRIPLPAIPKPRRRRPSRRVPTTTLETTPSEFRALVQKLTGLKPDQSLATTDAGDDGSNSSEVAPKPNHVTHPESENRADLRRSDTQADPAPMDTQAKTSPQDPSQLASDAAIDDFLHSTNTASSAVEIADVIAQQRLNIDHGLNPLTDLQHNNDDDQLDANDLHYRQMEMWLLYSDHAAADYNN